MVKREEHAKNESNQILISFKQIIEKVGGARVAESSGKSSYSHDQAEEQKYKDKLEGNNPDQSKVNPSTFAAPPNPKVQSGVPNVTHTTGRHSKPGGANHG